MKRVIIVLSGAIILGIIAVFMLLKTGPGDDEHSFAEREIVVIRLENQVRTADIWIMEDTPEKRKQSLWGDTTIKACEANVPLEITLKVVSTDHLYIVRMIDDKGLYYEACNVEILNGQSVVIRSEDNELRTLLAVYDENGSCVNEYEMFVAAL